MPVDRTLPEDLIHTLLELYARAETQLAQAIARELASGISSSQWADKKLSQLSTLRRALEKILDRLDSDMASEVQQAIALAYARGGQAALDELGRLAGLTAEQLAAIRVALPGTEAIQRLVWTLQSTLRGTHLRVLRWGLDVYRAVVATELPDVLQGTKTRVRAAQVTWETFLSQGVTGFVDRAGRRWQLASYVEMAVRTGVAQAAVEGHLDRLADAGINLVIVSNAPQECVKCRPWEGKVLTRIGTPGPRTVEVEHATHDGKMIAVRTAGTVAEAIVTGLMHPNCRHSLSAYLPGITQAPTHTADPDGDTARQKLRALERKVREWKLKETAALSADAKPAAAARVRHYQGLIRGHVAATGLHRQRQREQIGQAR